jgi:oxygen-dependent protoporphyrinogen oxidase
MKTIRDGGWLVETGPNSALETTPLFGEIFTALGIIGERVYAGDAGSNRYIVRNGILHPLPMSPGKFLGTGLWSLSGKLRLLREPFIGRATKEESIAEFVERRLGREFLDYAINPFVAGVYAGSPEQLSVQAAFPKLYALEAQYGGLIKGMIKGRNERRKRAEQSKDRARLFSFANGMQTFPDRLAGHLGTCLVRSAPVHQIIPVRRGNRPVYTIAYTNNGTSMTMEADAVILSSPARATASIIRPIDPEMASTLESIYYPPVAEVFLGFRREAIGRELDGFGFLVPAIERRNILGTIWSSSLFANRAPEGHAALTVFVGGSRQPELASSDDKTLLDLVLQDLRSLMNVTGDPIYSRIARWERAIPQYNVGYRKITDRMDRFEQNFRGAFICSNYRGGIAVGDCVMNADRTSRLVREYLTSG